MDKVIRLLPIPLTDEKKARLAEDLAAAEAKLQERKEQKRQDNKAINGAISVIEESIAEITQKINTGTEPLATECEWRIDREADKKYLFRLDTDTQIDWMGLTDEDRQGGLFEEKPAEATPPAEQPATEKQEMGDFMNKRLSRKKESVN